MASFEYEYESDSASSEVSLDDAINNNVSLVQNTSFSLDDLGQEQFINNSASVISNQSASSDSNTRLGSHYKHDLPEHRDLSSPNSATQASAEQHQSHNNSGNLNLDNPASQILPDQIISPHSHSTQSNSQQLSQKIISPPSSTENQAKDHTTHIITSNPPSSNSMFTSDSAKSEIIASHSNKNTDTQTRNLWTSRD